MTIYEGCGGKRGTVIHTDSTHGKRRRWGGEEKKTELYTQTALTPKEEDEVEERRKQSYTHRQHSRQKKKMGWKRKGNRAI